MGFGKSGDSLTRSDLGSRYRLCVALSVAVDAQF